MDKAHDGHGVANQMAKLEQRARERGWTVVYRLSDNDIGVTRKDRAASMMAPTIVSSWDLRLRRTFATIFNPISDHTTRPWRTARAWPRPGSWCWLTSRCERLRLSSSTPDQLPRDGRGRPAGV